MAVEIPNQWQEISTCRTFGSLDAIDTVSYSAGWIRFNFKFPKYTTIFLWKIKQENFRKKFGLFKHKSSFLIIQFLSCFQTLCKCKQRSCVDCISLLAIDFFDERRTCPVIIECLCSFSNRVWEGTNYHVTFKHVFTYFFCNFSMVSRTSFVHIPASSFHVLHICSTICSGYQPFCCDHTHDSFLRHSICFYGKKSFQHKPMIRKEFWKSKLFFSCTYVAFKRTGRCFAWKSFSINALICRRCNGLFNNERLIAWKLEFRMDTKKLWFCRGNYRIKRNMTQFSIKVRNMKILPCIIFRHTRTDLR